MDQQAVNKLIEFITSYGNIDGDHHKMWVIDQVLRKLCKTDKLYNDIIKKLKEDDYAWEKGVPP